MKNSLSVIGVLSLTALLIASQPGLISDIYPQNINRGHYHKTAADSTKTFDREYDIVIPTFQSPGEIPMPLRANPSRFNTNCRVNSIDCKSLQGQSPYAAKKGNVISRARIV